MPLHNSHYKGFGNWLWPFLVFLLALHQTAECKNQAHQWFKKSKSASDGWGILVRPLSIECLDYFNFLLQVTLTLLQKMTNLSLTLLQKLVNLSLTLLQYLIKILNITVIQMLHWNIKIPKKYFF